MITLTAKNLELRGIAHRVNKETGNLYYLLNVEDDEGTPYQFYAKDSSNFEQGLKKGDMVDISFVYLKFGKDERINVFSVRKSNE